MKKDTFTPLHARASAAHASFAGRFAWRIVSFAIVLSLPGMLTARAQTDGWYTARPIGAKTWVINEPGINDNMYLLEGADSTLLIDAGFGLGNLRDFVKTLSVKPLAVVSTHAHPDHTGGNYQFPLVHLGPGDLEAARGLLDPKVTQQIAGMVMKEVRVPDSLKFPDTLALRPTTLVPVRDGHVFKLGGRNVQVIALPGHSPGSLCLLDGKSGFLFTGDTTTETWLFFKESLSVEVFLGSLQKLGKSKNKFTRLFPGHGPDLPAATLDELAACCQLILSGKGQAKPYHSFLGIDGLSCSYKSVTIAYDPAKVKIKP
jgi:glyoxylase-like metal-dependent hydrolase (beta-lactamase superfamily II)